MAKLRNFQFLRNNTIAGPFASYSAARTAAETAFEGLELQDGEIALYSYKLQENGDTATVHTLLGIKRNGGIEILGNYDELTYELTAKYQSYVTDQIKNLDSEATDSNNGVSVTVKQVDGVINSVSVVAPSLTDAIEALDVNPFSLTTLNGDKLEGYKISEVDGKIVKGETAETLLTFVSAPTTENKVVTQSEINALDATVSNVEELTNGTETTDIRVEVVETDGNITEVNVTDTLATVAHSGKAENVSVAQIEGMTATNVQGALAELQGDIDAINDQTITAVADQAVAVTTDEETGNTTVGLVLADGEQVLSQNNDGLKTTLTVNTKKYPTESTTEGYVAEKAGKTYIQIKGIGGEVISETDAAAFVKDGFLQEVELIEAIEGQENVLRFTWNSDAGVQVTDIKVSELCDVYTADETYLHLNGFKFEHKTSGVTVDQYGADAAATLETAGESITFNVPSITVDAAGHITVAEDKAVKVALPASIDTAIQGGAGVDTTYIQTTVNRNATETNQLDVKATAIIGNYADENQKDGLATTTATKTYVDSKIDALEITTKVTNGVGIKVVDDVVEGSNDHKYTVSLAEVTVDKATQEDDYAGTTEAPKNTHTRVENITVDEYGRVTAYTLTTVKEDFDAGTY